MSRVKKALAILKKTPERTVTSVAREVGLNPSTIYAARRVAKETAHMRCPHCGSKLRYLSKVFKD